MLPDVCMVEMEGSTFMGLLILCRLHLFRRAFATARLASGYNATHTMLAAKKGERKLRVAEGWKLLGPQPVA